MDLMDLGKLGIFEAETQAILKKCLYLKLKLTKHLENKPKGVGELEQIYTK